MSDARHHRAHVGGPDTRIVFVEVPVETPVGGPAYGKVRHPPAYPANHREAWKPAQGIPRRASKAAASVNLLRNIVEQESALRQFLEESRRHAAG